MGSMAQTGLLLVPSDALGHTWALPGALGGGQGLPPQTGPKDLKKKSELSRNVATVGTPIRTRSTTVYGTGRRTGAQKKKWPRLAALAALGGLHHAFLFHQKLSRFFDQTLHI